MSEKDVDKGARGLRQVDVALNAIKVGICCLTPENLKAPWILYEAGALSKTIDDETRLCTYLSAGLRYQDIEPPLGMFQATRAEKDDTRRMVSAINTAISEEPVPESHLDEIFEAMWPRFQTKLKSMPDAEETVIEQPVEDEMDGIDYAKAARGLTAYCLALKEDVPDAKQEELATAVQKLDIMSIENAFKVRILGLFLKRAVGREVLSTALRELRVHLRVEPQ